MCAFDIQEENQSDLFPFCVVRRARERADVLTQFVADQGRSIGRFPSVFENKTNAEYKVLTGIISVTGQRSNVACCCSSSSSSMKGTIRRGQAVQLTNGESKMDTFAFKDERFTAADSDS